MYTLVLIFTTLVSGSGNAAVTQIPGYAGYQECLHAGRHASLSSGQHVAMDFSCIQGSQPVPKKYEG
jgi:hypothetical protein